MTRHPHDDKIELLTIIIAILAIIAVAYGLTLEPIQ